MAAVSIELVNESQKTTFANAFVRSKNAASAAMSAFPGDPGFALKMSHILPNDPFVLAEIARLKDEINEDDFLPTKAEIARKILDKADSAGDAEDYAKLMRLYCEIRGHIEKPGANGANVQVAVAPVMIVRDHGSDEEWQRKAEEQQRRLTLDAAN
jgi:phage terminase small subunit